MSNKLSHNVIIRKAIREDSSLIMDLIFDIWVNDDIWVNEHHFEVKREDFPDLHDVEKFYNQAGGLFLVAIVNNKIVGTVACEKLSNQRFALKRMFVNKAELRAKV